MEKYIGLLIPFIGTSLGAFFVYFTKEKFSKKKHAMLLSISAGIMMAASVWSLIIPSLEMGNVVSTTIGFIIGILFLSIVNKVEDNNTSKMIFAVTLHNIPEGMAVAVSFLSAMIGNSSITLVSCFMLSIGVAIQNIPEGAIISIPLRSCGKSKNKAFIYGILSGIVEPIFGIITILLAGIVVPILPYLLGFAAGAMVFVVVDELIPDASLYKSSPIYFSLGFLIMMILDVLFG